MREKKEWALSVFLGVSRIICFIPCFWANSRSRAYSRRPRWWGLPRFAVEEELAEGTLKELHIKMQDREIGVVSTYHKNKWMTPAMEMFLRLLKAEAVQTSLRRQETPD